jgi:hypothetical protein
VLAFLDEDFDHGAGMRRLDVERDLAGFQGDHVVVEVHRVAGLDQDFPHRDVALGAVAAGLPALGIDRDADFLAALLSGASGIKAGDEGAFAAGRQGDAHMVAAAGRDGCRRAFGVAHGLDHDFEVALGPHDLEAVADLEMVLHRDLGQAVGAVAGDIADILAAAGFGAAAQVVLVVAVGAAFVEAGGVAAIGEAVELADQARVEGSAGDGVVDGPAVDWQLRAT